MKYMLYTEEGIPLKMPAGNVMSGTLCDFESQVPINKGETIILDTKEMRLNNLNVQEVEVIQPPEHVIQNKQIAFSRLMVKKIR